MKDQQEHHIDEVVHPVPDLKIPGRELQKPVTLTKQQLRIIRDRLAIENEYYDKLKFL